MIGIIFNHDMRDDPYNQNVVNKGFNALETFICELEEEIYYSFGVRRDIFFQENTDEYVIVQHSCNLNLDQKQCIAEKINEILTLKKSVYKKEKPKKLIVFDKKEPCDCFSLKE